VATRPGKSGKATVSRQATFGPRLDLTRLFGGQYQGRRVLVTGHTGFKGSWLALWLQELGAEVFGYALPAPTSPSHWDLLNLRMHSEIGDVRDADHLRRFVAEVQPEIVFHLAAQPLVRLSYEQPLETFAVNVCGSLNLYEACRATDGVRAIVSITTDKVYENSEWVWGYRESDPLGGHDPYSASKACADIASASYRRSYWPVEAYGQSHRTLLCTARAGNVVGGGDWAQDRLVPDLMRGAAADAETILRNPGSTRPWQHVLEPLGGYLLLAQGLWEGRTDLARAWNFGPAAEGVLDVEQVGRTLQQAWPALRYRVERSPHAPHEATQLTLDCSLARSLLRWQPIWDGAPCFLRTAEWYRAYQERGELLTSVQLADYLREAARRGLCWTGESGAIQPEAVAAGGGARR
jgi:CDP-glucose 4,6-dehydratase